ncbi:MAG TPA: wax ester/triacylglycerol synthase family O-acyltransferase [Candidatus Binatia bacterium]|nr:wax ester/triacylglycerol synthase family O-acyltransferase [Candidatus Binatia bacterium]
MSTSSGGEGFSLVDTAWLHMEMPTNLMMVGGVGFFAEPLDRGRVITAVGRRLLPSHPRFTWRVEPSSVGPPRWVEDPMFDLAAHVRRVDLPAPGGDAELRALLSDLMSRPLDMGRPLWDMHVIDGYRDGGVLLTRIHHCVADGTALVRVLRSLTASSAEGSLRLAASERASVPRHAGSGLPDLDLGRALRGLVETAARVYTLGRLAALWPDPSTPLRGQLAVRKGVAWTEPHPVADLRLVRRWTGCTVNDVLVAAVAGALRSNLRRRRAALPPRIRALVPVDLRRDPGDDRLGNQFGLVFLDLPVGLAEPRGRLTAVHRRMEEARRSLQPSVALEVLGVVGLVPQLVQRQVIRFFGAKATAVVTNVRGPADSLYLAGEKLRDLLFFVPQSAGLGLGISIMSYAGNLQIGVIADSGLVPDPGTIARDLNAELRRLTHLGGGRART